MKKLLLLSLLGLITLPLGAMDVGGIIDAIQDDNIDETRSLLNEGLAIEPDFKIGLFFIQYAQTVPMVTMLIEEYGADINGGIMGTQLSTAKNAAVAQVLLDHGADVYARSSMTESTPLHSATDVDMTRVLLIAGADPNAQDSTGNTPLMLTAYRNTSDQARLLLRYGASPDIVNKKGATPRGVAQKNSDVAHLFEQERKVREKFKNMLQESKSGNSIMLLRNREMFGNPRNPYTIIKPTKSYQDDE